MNANANTRKVFSGCALCYHSCGIEVEVADGRVVGIEGQKSHPLNRGYLCPKGRATIDHIYHPERLRRPLKKDGAGFKPISWDRALDEIANRLMAIKAKYGPQALGFFCGSVGVENFEMVALTHRFRAAYGSPNYFSVESICYRMRIRCRQITFGKYPVEELDANLYILWGHNPEESDFPLRLAITRNRRRGSKIVVIDPKRIRLADKADLYLKIRPGTDGALALALINVIIGEKLYDREFIDRWTTGFDKLVPHVRRYTPEWAEEITWIAADDIRKLARMFATTTGAAIYQGTCTQDQQANGTQTNRAIAILQTIVGGINVPGGWVLSPRLALKNILLPTEGDRQPLGTDSYPLFYELWGRTSPYGIVSMVPESIPDKLKGFFVLGGNPAVTMPDANAFKAAFERLPLLVVYEQFMTDTTALADYILPATSHLEGWSIAYNYNVCHCLPYLMLREQAIEPVGECRSVLDMVKGLSERMNMSEVFPWSSEKELVRDLLQPCELNFDYLHHQKPEGAFYQQKVYETAEDMWRTPTGKIEIYSQAVADAGFDPLPTYREPHKSPRGERWTELGERYPLILTTGQRDLFYTASQMHHIDGLRRHARVDERIADGVIMVPHGWSGKANCNLLTDCRAESREPIMGYPTWKSQLCTLKPVSREDLSAVRP